MAVLGASLFSIGTQAADICTAVALRDVPAIEDIPRVSGNPNRSLAKA